MTTALFQCRRCGKCCRKGGPALHSEDLSIINTHKTLGLEDLITFRKNEAVYDQPSGKIILLPEEMVKIRPVDEGTACAFYDGEKNACSIYQTRPVECMALECTEPEKLKSMYQLDRISRRDIIPAEHPLRELIDSHDEFCAMGTVHMLAQELDTAQDMNDKVRIWNGLTKIVEYDNRMRDLVAEKTGVDEHALSFLFGRPMETIFTDIGIKCLRNEDGSRRYILLK